MVTTVTKPHYRFIRGYYSNMVSCSGKYETTNYGSVYILVSEWFIYMSCVPIKIRLHKLERTFEKMRHLVTPCPQDPH